MFKALRLLSFDVTNTLIAVSDNIGRQYLKVATQYGLQARGDDTASQLDEAFKKNFVKLNEELPNFGHGTDVTSVQWWSRLVTETFHNAGYTEPGDQEKLRLTAAHLFKQYSRGNCWQVQSGVPELLSSLQKHRPELNLAVASNFDERLEIVLQDVNIRHYFRFMFISRQVGLVKPNSLFFEHIMKVVDVSPSEYLHIGDSIENDYFPVRQLGANALVINPTFSEADRAKIDSVHIVNSVKDLQKLILSDD